MQTQPYQQLPPGGGMGGAPAVMPAGYIAQPVAAGPMVPALPPKPRSTGFWVGVTTAITLGVVAALLLGFFIGRGTRLSSNSVQDKLVAQSQSDRIAEQQDISNQKAQDQKTLNEATRTARRNGYNSGYRQGKSDGVNQGASQQAASDQASQAAQNQQSQQAIYDLQLQNWQSCLSNPATTFCGPPPSPPSG